MACSKGVDNFVLSTGPYKGQSVMVDGPEYENAARTRFQRRFLQSAIISLKPISIAIPTASVPSPGAPCLAFVMECYENGILNKERTGGLELTLRQLPMRLELLHQVARGEGFGLIAGQGVRRMKKIFAENGWGDPAFMQDIGMENKGLEYSQYMSKESLAQQGGYAMTNKGPQHDEAWLIFMDMVNNQIPTFENKAEALHYFPMFRTWFGLVGLCKLPWNDVEPENNAETDEPAKVPEHVDNYVTIYKAVTGRPFDKDEMIEDSERVYNFQRVFNIRRGYGRRKDDDQPYRACGPVTVEEYESRAERYDKQLKEKIGFDPAGKSTAEKMKVLRKYREEQYDSLRDAVYKRRGWNNNGIPTIEHLRKIGMDFPEVIEVVRNLQ